MAPKRLCLITALAPVPAFLGGSCPLGCSLSAPATGGCSVFSLQCSMYAAGSEEEKRAGCPLHGDIIAQLFVFCKGRLAGGLGLRRPPADGDGGFVLACALDQGRVWLGGRRCPTCPPSNVFRNRGTPPCTPGGGCAPCTPLGERRGASSPAAEYGGKDKMRLLDGWSCCGVRPPSAKGLAWRAPLSHRPTLQRFWKQGDSPCTPGGGCAPPAPRLGDGRELALARLGAS